MANNGLIMYHVKDNDKRIQLEVLCMGISVETKELKAADLSRSVGELAGIKGFNKNTAAENIPMLFNMPEIIIFSGVSDSKLDEFLDRYKNMGIEPTRLKAVVTPINAGWSLYRLIDEISKEANAMKS